MFEKTECMEFTCNEWLCKVCGTNEHLALIDIPYVFRYLCVELAAMNIKTRLKIGNCVEDYQDYLKFVFINLSSAHSVIVYIYFGNKI